MKPAIRSALTDRDIEAALAYYMAENARAALGFLDELQRATERIESNPSIGSPRYAHELNIPRLRFWSLRRFPYALFYIEHADHLDVIRCVHLNRDVPVCLRDDPP